MVRLAARSKLLALGVVLAGSSALSAHVSAAQSGPAFTIANDGGIPGNFFPGGPYPLVARSESGDFVVVYFQRRCPVRC